MLTTTASLLALSPLCAQDATAVDSGPGITSGSDAAMASSTAPQFAAPTTPDEAAALEASFYGADEAVADAAAEPVAQSRPWNVNLHASVDSRYDSNIFIASAGKQADYLTRLMAGGGFILGDYTAKQNNYLTSDYTGIGELFGRHQNENAYEQNATLESQILLGHVTVRGNFQFQDLADEDIDIGARTRRQVYTGNVSARYDLSDKTYLEATGQFTVANYALYLDSNDERGGLSFNYRPGPNVTFGLGAMGGVLNVQDSGCQTYEQLLASSEIDLTGKFTLKASGGGEERQFQDGVNFASPIFELTADYKPFEGLDLNLTGYRRVLNSAFYSGDDYVATGIDAGIGYDFSSRISLLLDGGYVNSVYKAVTAGAGIARTDDYYYIRPSLRYTASRYWNVELYYFYRTNDSTISTSSFDDTQAGVDLTLTY